MKVTLTVPKEKVLQIPAVRLNECSIILDQNSDEYAIKDLPVLNELPFSLDDRAYCETDLSKLQPLPYITVFDKTNRRFFTYLRGKQGTETRLHDLLSIGLGGHMEQEVTSDTSFNTLVYENILRELKEEANIELGTEEKNALLTSILTREYTTIYTEYDNVAKVHLCLWFCIELDHDRLTEFEEGNILAPRWFTFREFEVMLQATGFKTKLEYWTELCYELLRQKYDK